ncbi:DUF6221 family protein [Streptomyces sp. NPDC057717]|uniref:DUF6221 family protein n=1 Tax=unclassified Streptomyces TaxID=2593676 RepID=UPI0036A537BE
MDDLVQWLGEQLDEDERIARAAHEPNWSTDGRRGIHYGVEDGWMADALTTGDADHIACHDPARVLREIEAKRRIIEGHKRYAAERRRMMGGWDPQSNDSPILAALASVYADRPGYREEWRP